MRAAVFNSAMDFLIICSILNAVIGAFNCAERYLAMSRRSFSADFVICILNLSIGYFFFYVKKDIFKRTCPSVLHICMAFVKETVQLKLSV